MAFLLRLRTDIWENLGGCMAPMNAYLSCIGVDTLGYLAQEDVHCLAEGSACGGYCDACFSGKYPTEVPTKTAKSRYDYKKSERRIEE